jgi:hypothetical protein
MKIYFSGCGGLNDTPEALIPERSPDIMLSFYKMEEKSTFERLREFRQQRRYEKKPFKEITAERQREILDRLPKEVRRRLQKRLKRQRDSDEQLLHYGGLFMDSGAFGLYSANILKRFRNNDRQVSERYLEARRKRLGPVRGQRLDPIPKHLRRPDYSKYDLAKGTEFRDYCDGYAHWIKSMKAGGMDDLLVTNVDVIHNPEKTWEVQQYFEKEHGLFPVPVIHAGTKLHYLDRYLKTGKYDLIGLGGGRGMGKRKYKQWADSVFIHLCPETNNYEPIVKVHGFAVTSPELMRRWPWWSVDSTTWVKLAAYGWIYIPKWSSKKRDWDYEKPPRQINFSWKSAFRKERNKHFTTLGPLVSEEVTRWIKHLSVEVGSIEWDRYGLEIEGDSNNLEGTGEINEFSLSRSCVARSLANLHYFKNYEKSLLSWPHRLDPKIVERRLLLKTQIEGLGVF